MERLSSLAGMVLGAGVLALTISSQVIASDVWLGKRAVATNQQVKAAIKLHNDIAASAISEADFLALVGDDSDAARLINLYNSIVDMTGQSAADVRAAVINNTIVKWATPSVDSDDCLHNVDCAGLGATAATSFSGTDLGSTIAESGFCKMALEGGGENFWIVTNCN